MLRRTWRPLGDQFMGLFRTVKVLSSRTGVAGKTQRMRLVDADCLVDDNRSICQEAVLAGYRVYPVRTAHQLHSWTTNNFCRRRSPAPYVVDSFAEAVEHFVLLVVHPIYPPRTPLKGPYYLGPWTPETL